MASLAAVMRRVRSSSSGQTALNLRAKTESELMGRDHITSRPSCYPYLLTPPYHGKHTLPKTHVARMRISLPATSDYWVNDSAGDPLLVITAQANAGLVKMLPGILDQVRALVGRRRVTVVFDRGGYSPKLFQQILASQFDLLTYRKGRGPRIPRQCFHACRTRRDGRTVTYLLADQEVRLLKGRLRLRQVTRLAEDGHQTPILTESRRPARSSTDGTVVRLADQDRSRWDQALIAQGHQLVRACLRRNRPGPFQIQAAIAAVHADAPSAKTTDWSQIIALYDQLYALRPHAVIALNRSVAVAELHGPDEGLAALARIDIATLDNYQPYHAARADLLARAGRRDEALAAYDRAIELTANAVERDFLMLQRAAL